MKSRNIVFEALNEQDDDAIKVASSLREAERTALARSGHRPHTPVYTCLHASQLYGNRGQAASHPIIPYII